MLFQLPSSEKGQAAIYCLVCFPTGDTYIGSTFNLYERCRAHGSLALSSSATLYRKMREVGVENFMVEVVEKWDNDCAEMRAKEAALIAIIRPSLNKIVRNPNAEYISLSGEDIMQCYISAADHNQIMQLTADTESAKAFRESAGISRQVLERLKHLKTGSKKSIEKVRKHLKAIKQSHRQVSS